MTDVFYTDYPQYTTILARCARLGLHAGRPRVFSFGQSVLGRELLCVGIGNLEDATLVVGGVHALEMLGVLSCFRFCEQVLDAAAAGEELYDTDMAQALDHRGLLVVPCLNPDGLELVVNGIGTAGPFAPFVYSHCGGAPADMGDLSRWQANAHGVDLNHNFDAGFFIAQRQSRFAGVHRPGPTKFGGPYPHREPETAAIVALCEQYRPRQVVALHSQGEEIYYQYGPHTPQYSHLVARMLAAVSGYELAVQGGTASHAGLKDWFILHYGKPGYTLEIGRGQNPLPISDFYPVYEKVGPMLAVLTIA